MNVERGKSKIESVFLWDRLPGESTKAYAAFCAYRDYGLDRSIAKVEGKYREKHGCKALLYRWSVKFNWVSRCEKFDIFIEKERRKELQAHFTRMIKRHAEQAELLQEKAIIALNNVEPNSLSNTELLRFLEAGMKLEREILSQVPGVGVDTYEEIQTNEDKVGARISAEMLERTERLLKNRSVPETNNT